MKANKEIDSIARIAVNALIEDAQVYFKGQRKDAFALAIYNAVRFTNRFELANLRELLRKHGFDIKGESVLVKVSWSN